MEDDWKQEDKYVWPPKDTTDHTNPVVGECTKCGLKLHKVMWYACSRYPCPSGLGSNITL